MKITEPKLEDREEQPTVGIRTQVPMKAFKKVIPELLDEVFACTGRQGITPVGPPFMRFHVINMAGNRDVELGGG
jgi:effector-binding domain-containing protein